MSLYLHKLSPEILAKILRLLKYLCDKENFVVAMELPYLYAEYLHENRQAMALNCFCNRDSFTYACRAGDLVWAMNILHIYNDVFPCITLDDCACDVDSDNGHITHSESNALEFCFLQIYSLDHPNNDNNEWMRIIKEIIRRYPEIVHRKRDDNTDNIIYQSIHNETLTLFLMEASGFDYQLIKDGSCSLYRLACRIGKVNVVMKLIEVFGLKCLTEEEMNFGESLMTVACSESSSIPLEIINKYGSGCIEWIRNDGKNALLILIDCGREKTALEIIKHLKYMKYHPNQEDYRLNYIFQSIVKTMKHLSLALVNELDFDCHPNVEVDNGEGTGISTMISAIFYGYTEVFFGLARRYGEKSGVSSSSKGNNILMVACSKKNLQVANYILDNFSHKINPRMINILGATLFHFCLDMGCEYEEFIIRIIDTYKHDLLPHQIYHKNGKTPLILSVEGTTERIAFRILKMFGKESVPEHRDCEGKTALDYAKEKKYNVVIEILENMALDRIVEWIEG